MVSIKLSVSTTNVTTEPDIVVSLCGSPVNPLTFENNDSLSLNNQFI